VRATLYLALEFVVKLKGVKVRHADKRVVLAVHFHVQALQLTVADAQRADLPALLRAGPLSTAALGQRARRPRTPVHS
jgi:hypothetical protein